ncbi:ABC transporter ATP-binding protein [Mycolicibacterium vaccae]|jgi:NitT/TauT family transport system ATP-binding protein|uniref:ABC transporter-like protein n=1 Tax=Mycolicibacterium vaccae ATCC 25954 TaxID=1194972 RepID=K0UZN4_MYCVA|nr:ABC transporter ATP-binding protein [Mycolicibacterium vaccae]ANI41972.1 ABC transporter [Mycolicibacterium vaccae 95051]EJZ10525.1 ABC transporter-like protein [Mycolicibacterium vaccae ATCC 25954]MCV7062414.1 ABC transporter ATP-binding protein [Mycolicibacterium vaccae]
MLSVKNMQRVYGTGVSAVEAVRDLSLEVDNGEFVCIVGPSGAGKTTLLKCLSGLLTPTKGTVALDGEVVTEPPKKMASVFQDYSRSLMPWLTVERNVGLPLRNKFPSAGERRRRVEQALEEVGLSGFGPRYPWELSGGMQQRVAIARGLAYQPEILLLDEPFASVDAQTRADLEDLIQQVHLTTGVTMLLVTHDIDEAVYLADRVVVLSARPSVVLETVRVDLPRPRTQLITKGLPQFAELRAQVMGLIRARDRRTEPTGG